MSRLYKLQILYDIGKFSRKGYPKQTSFGYRIFYKFYNLRKGIHTKLDFR